MKKKRRNKLVSLITTGLLILNQIGVLPELWALPPREVKIPSSGFTLSLPPELGTIQSIHSGTGPTLVHIQTAHGNYEAQKKIQAILHYLKDTYGFKLLLLEGSASKLNPELLKFFPHRMDLTMKMAEELTEEALVKGDELFLLEEPEAEAYGIEDIATYRRTREAFKAVILQKENSEQFLQDMDMQIERLTGPYLNKRLRSFLKRLEAFGSKTLPLLDWLTYLKTQAQEVLNLDLTDPLNQFDWPMLLRIFKLREFESKLDLNAFARERDQFLRVIANPPKYGGGRSNPTTTLWWWGNLAPRNDFDEIKRLLSSPLSQDQLPDPETGLLFERMVEALPENFNYDAFPNVKLFIGHLILQSELKGNRLMGERERLMNQISLKLAKTEEEKKILSLLKDYRLLERLFALELMPEDYEAIVSLSLRGPPRSVAGRSNPNTGRFASASVGTSPRNDSLMPSKMIQRFLELNNTKRVRNLEFSHLEEIDSLFAKALQFYQGVKERDTWMLQNIQTRLKETSADKAIVITGGFHTKPFKDYFQTQDYNYALIAPKITSIEGREAYLRAVLQNSAITSKSTMETTRLTERAEVRQTLGDNLLLMDQWTQAIRLKVLKQSEEPVRESPRSVTRPRSEVRVEPTQDETLSRLRRNIFGEGIDDWLALHQGRGDKRRMIEAVEAFLAHPGFRTLLNGPGREFGVEFIRFAVSNNFYLGTKSLYAFLTELKKQAGPEIKDKIQIIQLPIRAYVSLVTSLRYPSIQAFLESEEFRQLAREDKLGELVRKIQELELPLESENLAHIYSALPAQLSPRVPKREIGYSKNRRAEVRLEGVGASKMVEEFATHKMKNRLELSSYLFPLRLLGEYGKAFLTAVLIALGVVSTSLPAEAAQISVLGISISAGTRNLNFFPERIDAAKRFLGIKSDSHLQEAYLLGADLALNEGGLALIETLFKDSLVAIVIHNPEETKRLEEYNQERIAKGKSPVLVVKTLRRAERVLTQKLKGKGMVYGFASPREVSSEWIRILKQNFQVMSQARLQSFAETFGILSLVEEFKARFQIQKSA